MRFNLLVKSTGKEDNHHQETRDYQSHAADFFAFNILHGKILRDGRLHAFDYGLVPGENANLVKTTDAHHQNITTFWVEGEMGRRTKKTEEGKEQNRKMEGGKGWGNR